MLNAPINLVCASPPWTYCKTFISNIFFSQCFYFDFQLVFIHFLSLVATILSATQFSLWNFLSEIILFAIGIYDPCSCIASSIADLTCSKHPHVQRTHTRLETLMRNFKWTSHCELPSLTPFLTSSKAKITRKCLCTCACFESLCP